MTPYQLMITFICCVAVFQTVFALPILTNTMTAEFEYPEMTFDFPPDMDKRDLEEVMLPDIPESLNFLMELPRTDRKTLLESYYQQDPSDDVQVVPKSIFPEIESAPSQKEVTGPIVVGPQTKSTQTSSAKKP